MRLPIPDPLPQLARALAGTEFAGKVWLVGGAVRDLVLGIQPKTDLDLVVEGDALRLAHLLYEAGLSRIHPVTYPQFGTAMIQVGEATLELTTARRESYRGESRKPVVQPASLLEDAQRRDFTVNALLQSIESGDVRDPLQSGLADLELRLLRTPLDPHDTFSDDPLRMLRAVRFRWKLGFEYAPGLEDAIKAQSSRLEIISAERIRDEWLKMLQLPDGDRAMADLLALDLLVEFAPELRAMVGVEQGSYHHLDVWEHTLLVMRNAGFGDLTLTLAALLHDVGKPRTRMLDAKGQTRFFGHESVGAQMAREFLRRMKVPGAEIKPVVLLVQNHMRLGSSQELSLPATRRLIRDLGDQLPRLLALVEADASSLKPGVRKLNLGPLRARIADVLAQSPREKLASPLSGAEIMAELGLGEGPEVGEWKRRLTERVLDGMLEPGDKAGARAWLRGAGTGA